MLNDVEKNYKNLIRKKRWMCLADTKSSSKCMFLLATQKQQPKDCLETLQQILLTSDGESFRQCSSSTNENKNNGWPFSKKLTNLAAPKPSELEKKKVNGKMTYYCDFHKWWSYVAQHASESCRATKHNAQNKQE